MPARPTRIPPRPTRLALAGCFAVALSAALPAYAQIPTVPAPPEGVQDGAPDTAQSLIEQGARLLFQGIIAEIAPQIGEMTNELRDTTRSLWPAMEDLARLMDDIGNYDLPERLDNGDILIRRRAGAPPPPPLGEGLQGLLPRPDDAPPPPAPESQFDGPQLDL